MATSEERIEQEMLALFDEQEDYIVALKMLVVTVAQGLRSAGNVAGFHWVVDRLGEIEDRFEPVENPSSLHGNEGAEQ